MQKNHQRMQEIYILDNLGHDTITMIGKYVFAINP
jgi:hypothetical protein